MTRDELKIKLYEMLETETSMPGFLTLEIMRWVDEYTASIKPAKEVIPREWAEYIESFKGRNTNFDYLIYGADYDLGLSFGDGSYQKFMRAILNGYEVESEKQYVLPMGSGNSEIKNNQYAFYDTDYDRWIVMEEPIDIDEAMQTIALHVSQEMIDGAPDWVKALKPVEVKG